MSFSKRSHLRRTFSGVILAALALVGSCSDDEPLNRTGTTGAVFDETNVCDHASWAWADNNVLRLTPTGGNNCPFFAFTVTVSDSVGGVPVGGAPVVVAWHQSDYPYYSIPLSQPGVDLYYLDSGTHVFTKYSDENGHAIFRIRGGYSGPFPTQTGNCPSNPVNDWEKAGYWICDRFVNFITISSPDLDNNGVVNAADQSRFMHDLSCQPSDPNDKSKYYARSDLNGDHRINPADLSKILGLVFNLCPSYY